jgi:hypothetical protein
MIVALRSQKSKLIGFQHRAGKFAAIDSACIDTDPIGSNCNCRTWCMAVHDDDAQVAFE